jgi:hypothetical protein
METIRQGIEYMGKIGSRKTGTIISMIVCLSTKKRFGNVVCKIE